MEPADIVIVGAGAGAKLVWTSVQDRSVVVVEKGLVGGYCPYLACVPSKAMLRSASVWELAANDQFRGLFTGRSEPADAYRQAVARRERIVHGRDDSATAAALEKTGARLLRGTGRVVRPGVVEVDGTQVAYRDLVLNTGSVPAVPAVKHNRPLVMLCLASLAFLTAVFSLQTVQVYYARDVLGNATLLAVLTLLSMGAIFVIAPLIPRVVRPLGKKHAFLFFGAIGVVAGAGISLSPPSITWLPLVFFALMGVSTAGVNTLMWALEADTVEYGEWRTGVRTEGITYALFSFTRKLGQAVGGALAAFVIGLGGYVGGMATQSQSAINAIRFASGFAPAICILIGIAIFFRYPLTEARFREMVRDIAARRVERRAAAATGAPTLEG